MGSLDKFFSSYPLKKIKKGTVLLRPEDAISEIFYLTSGNVRQYIISADGNEFVIHIFKPGSFFPIVLILGEIENRFYFEAANDIGVKEAPPDKVVGFLKKDKKVLLDLTKRLSRGLIGVLTRFEANTDNTVDVKLLSLLTYLSKSFPEARSQTHQDLAAWLGVSRETVSRNMKKLENHKQIQYERRKIVVL